jgi:PhnB protein
MTDIALKRGGCPMPKIGLTRRKFVALAAPALVAAMPAHSKARITSRVGQGEEMMILTPYLLFDGSCHDAMQFYHSVLGGELTLTKVKDSPVRHHMPAFQQEKTINAHLRSNAIEISASDWLMPNRTPVRGNTVCLYLSGGTFDDLNALFTKLSDGAEVTDPLKEMFFGTYGALNDKFGVRWMFESNKQ